MSNQHKFREPRTVYATCVEAFGLQVRKVSILEDKALGLMNQYVKALGRAIL